MISVSQERFEEMVGAALDTLPPELARMMRNVAVVVEDGTNPHLLGLYHGVPLTVRRYDYSAVLAQLLVQGMDLAAHLLFGFAVELDH